MLHTSKSHSASELMEVLQNLFCSWYKCASSKALEVLGYALAAKEKESVENFRSCDQQE